MLLPSHIITILFYHQMKLPDFAMNNTFLCCFLFFFCCPSNPIGENKPIQHNNARTHMDESHTRTGYFIALLLASINAEEKWSWSKNDNGGNNGGNNYLSSGSSSNSNRDTIPDRTNVRSDVIQFQDAKRPAADDDRRRYNPQQDVR